MVPNLQGFITFCDIKYISGSVNVNGVGCIRCNLLCNLLMTLYQKCSLYSRNTFVYILCKIFRNLGKVNWVNVELEDSPDTQ